MIVQTTNRSMCSGLCLFLAWKPWESISKRELSVISLMRQLMELILVCFHLSYEVDEVFRFLESIQVLCIDNIPELVLNLDHEFDNIEAVEAVVAED